LWTVWSVEVRVLSGALGKPRKSGLFHASIGSRLLSGGGRIVVAWQYVHSVRPPGVRSNSLDVLVSVPGRVLLSAQIAVTLMLPVCRQSRSGPVAERRRRGLANGTAVARIACSRRWRRVGPVRARPRAPHPLRSGTTTIVRRCATYPKLQLPSLQSGCRHDTRLHGRVRARATRLGGVRSRLPALQCGTRRLLNTDSHRSTAPQLAPVSASAPGKVRRGVPSARTGRPTAAYPAMRWSSRSSCRSRARSCDRTSRWSAASTANRMRAGSLTNRLFMRLSVFEFDHDHPQLRLPDVRDRMGRKWRCPQSFGPAELLVARSPSIEHNVAVAVATHEVRRAQHVFDAGSAVRMDGRGLGDTSPGVCVHDVESPRVVRQDLAGATSRVPVGRCGRRQRRRDCRLARRSVVCERRSTSIPGRRG
jgi:hypothetical protein